MPDEPLRIAVIDAVPTENRATDGGITDAQKFIDLLAPFDATAVFEVFDAAEGELPEDLGLHDGIMLTGSPCSVHDDFAWIADLSSLLVEADRNDKRIVASCFGHQLVAKTFGGEVSPTGNGWLIGNYRLHISRHHDWMVPVVETTHLYHFNQERVTRLPDGAESFATSDEYPDFAYTLGDNILCFQGHPEQPLRAMNNFLGALKPEMPDAEYRRARTMIDSGVPDAALWGDWMMRFFSGGRGS